MMNKRRKEARLKKIKPSARSSAGSIISADVYGRHPVPVSDVAVFVFQRVRWRSAAKCVQDDSDAHSLIVHCL